MTEKKIMDATDERPRANVPETPLATTLPPVLEHVRLLKEILLEEQELLLAGTPEALEDVILRKMMISEQFGILLEKSRIAEIISRPDSVSTPLLAELRSGLLHLSEIASVNLVIARESAQTVSGFLKALRQEEGDFETYGARGDLGTTLRSPSMVSTRR